MTESQLNQIQLQIYKAAEAFCEKTMFTEAVLAKKIRDNTKITSKPKAGLSFNDIETALEALANDKQIYYALHLNSANDLLVKKSEAYAPLQEEARHRRIASEKSMSILTSADIKATENKKTKGSSDKKTKIRTQRKNINIYSDYEEQDY